MKRLSTNENDKYLIDKNKHEELLKNGKALKKLIKYDARKFCSIALLSGCLVISAKSIKEFGGMLAETYEFMKYTLESPIKEDNDKELIDIINSGYVSVLNVPLSVESKFYFKDKYLYNQENEIVKLTNYTDPVYFAYCNLDYETLSNINLRESKTKELCLNYSCVDNKCIECLPESVEELGLSYCFFLNDLKNLPIQCPNIKVLHLDSTTSVKDYSFLAGLENLEEVSIRDSAYITEDLIRYLDDRGIKHNLTEADVKNNQRTNAIIDAIITPDMSDKEKIHAICKYILENVEYDMKQAADSNIRPLNCILEDGKGVCVSYAYLTNILFEKANINTYLLSNDDHIWNLVNVDGKYYYVDTTGMDGLDFNKLLFDLFGVGFGYMTDTENVTMSSMSKLQSGEVLIPDELLNDVLSGADEKDIFEKYGQIVDAFLIYVSYIFKAVLVYFSPKMIVSIKNKSKQIFHDYQNCKYRL